MLRLFVIKQHTKKTKTNKNTIFLTPLKKALPSRSVSFLLENIFLVDVYYCFSFLMLARGHKGKSVIVRLIYKAL
jgi:hypothetical protein